MKRVADLVLDYLSKLGIDTVFTVTGGGAMFLNDACALSKNIKTVCNHHEQASAMAAVAYAKLKNSFGCAILTTGCGATNAITGLLDAYQDNNPVIFISGQVKRKETSFANKIKLRQFGVQEANIIDVVKPMTNYATMISDPKDIFFELDKAIFLSKYKRPGPVWIDIPLDIQGAYVNKTSLKRYKPNFDKGKKSLNLSLLENALSVAKRPIIIAGNGIRLASSIKEFVAFVRKYKIPFVTSFLSIDLAPELDQYNIGRLGIKGDRAGNFALQNSDLIICLGSRLSVALTGFEYNYFGREAKLFVIDIDDNEHKKNTVDIYKFYKLHLKDFFKKFHPQLKNDTKSWRSICLNWKKKWPVCLDDYLKKEKKLINKYAFIKIMMSCLGKNTVVVSDAGSSYYVTSQTFWPNFNQRYITSGAQADMGFTLPASIGAYFALKKDFVVGITGDGSLQMNIQELQTLIHYKIPVKLVVWNNNGYLSIRATQKKFFSNRKFGVDRNNGVSFPNLRKISNAYGLRYFSSNKIETLTKTLNEAFKIKGPAIIEIFCPEDQEIIPSASSLKLSDGRMISKPLEDMYPFLDESVFLENMIVKPLKN